MNFIYENLDVLSCPAYFLARDESFTRNKAAAALDKGSTSEDFVLHSLQAALASSHNDNVYSPSSTMLPDAFLSTRSLTILPSQNGVLGVMTASKEAPMAVFSSGIRESLTNIFAILPIISKRMHEEDVRYLDEVQTNCYNILRTASNLETTAQLQKNNFSTHLIDLTSLVQSIGESVASVTHGLQIPLTTLVPEDGLLVQGNKRLLNEAVLNILRNCFTFTQDDNQITMRLQKRAGRAVLLIKDKGMGIKPDHLSQLFEPYFSRDPHGDCDEMQPGLGMGLFNAMEIARLMGGMLTVESRFGEGSSFVLSLPLADDLPQATVMHSDSADYLLNRFSPVYVHLSGFCRIPPVL